MKERKGVANFIESHQSSRELLFRLATQAYAESFFGNTSLDLNKRQAKKYQQYQFTFDPSLGFEHYRVILTDITNDAEKAKLAFEELQARHPFGVEIWVHPKAGRLSPLVENNAQLAVDSILSASQMAVADLKEQNKEDRHLQTKAERISKLLVAAHDKTTAQIQSLYEVQAQPQAQKLTGIKAWFSKFFNKPIPPEESQFQQAMDMVSKYHKFAVAKLATLQTVGVVPEKQDYKHAFTTLHQYEQKQKLRGFTRGQVSNDKIGDQFNRDIFSIDEVVEDNGKISAANWHYHQRHYTLTQDQVAHKAQAEDIDPAQINIFTPQATATSHGEPILANYALVEEGRADNNSLTIDFVNARHGSPTPNELYPESMQPRSNRQENHEATYRAYLNMDQYLQQMRTQVVEGVLSALNSRQLLSNTQVINFSRVFTVSFSKLLKDQVLFGNEVKPIDLINKTFDHLKMDSTIDQGLVSKAITLFSSPNIEKYADEITNIKNLHTHLITATGLASTAQAQRYHFYDARIAQYATWDNKGGVGYIYMCNGVNQGRYDTLGFDVQQVLAGNNAVAMIELHKEIIALPQDSELVSSYQQALSGVKEASCAYIRVLQRHMPLQIATQKLELTASQLQKQLRTVTTGNVKTQLAQQLQAVTTQLGASKRQLQLSRRGLDTLRGNFKKAESKLHDYAKNLNKQLYQELKANSAAIEALATSNDPGDRKKYLSQKSYLLAQELLNESKYGLAKWKLADNNGLMQSLLQLSSEQAGLFASAGCKSANDREVLLAMIISKLSTVTSNNQPLTPEFFKNLLQDAQAAFAWHISQRQTALDRSAIPKTAQSMLQYAARALNDYAKQQGETLKYKHFTQYEPMAAHKRATGHKKVTDNEMLSYALASYDNEYDVTLLNWWLGRASSKALPGITQDLKKYALEKGFSLDEKHAELRQIKANIVQASKGWFSSSDPEEVKALSTAVEKLLFLQKVQLASNENKVTPDQTQIYQQLSYFLDRLQARTDQETVSHGQGWLQIQQVIADYKKAKVQYANDPIPTHQLADFYLKLQYIAAPRRDDYTNALAQRGFFSQKRPPWLRELYKGLQEDISNAKFDSLLPEPSSAPQLGEVPPPRR